MKDLFKQTINTFAFLAVTITFLSSITLLLGIDVLPLLFSQIGIGLYAITFIVYIVYIMRYSNKTVDEELNA